jgi:hypothetical protein
LKCFFALCFNFIKTLKKVFFMISGKFFVINFCKFQNFKFSHRRSTLVCKALLFIIIIEYISFYIRIANPRYNLTIQPDCPRMRMVPFQEFPKTNHFHGRICHPSG